MPEEIARLKEQTARIERSAPALNPSCYCSDELLKWIHDKLYDSTNTLVAIWIALFGEAKLVKDTQDRIEVWGSLQPETLSDLIFSINTWVTRIRDLADELRVRIGK